MPLETNPPDNPNGSIPVVCTMLFNTEGNPSANLNFDRLAGLPFGAFLINFFDNPPGYG